MPEEKKEIAVGGQAVIEGVMMRGPRYIATAIRRKNGTIEVKRENFNSITKKYKLLGLPIIRGFVSLIEMLIIGLKTLTFSADRAALDIEDVETKKEKQNSKISNAKDKFVEILSLIIALIFSFLLFAYLPYQSAEWIKLGKETIYFNIFAGLIRIIIFVLYIFLISLMKDVKRVFEYHGAEHKSVFAYEKNEELIFENVDKNSTLHPRCGTSFIFFVFLISILIFSIVDTIIAYYLGKPPNFMVRLGYHLLFVPFISGISYEILKLTGKKINHLFVKILSFPGMSLQRITTKKPDANQIETSIIALKAALEMDLSAENIVWIE